VAVCNDPTRIESERREKEMEERNLGRGDEMTDERMRDNNSFYFLSCHE
jgi:hypothetical protein